MDEMTRVRELHADTPAADPMVLAAGRRRLTSSFTPGGGLGRARLLRTDRRFAAVGAVFALTAVVTVTAVLGAQLGSAPTAGNRAQTAGAAGMSSDVLLRAAAVLEKRPTPPEPRDDQWVYIRTELVDAPSAQHTDAKDVGIERVWKPGVGPDSWTRYGGSLDQGGTRGVTDATVYTPRDVYRAVRTLPQEPAEVLAAARAMFPSDSAPYVMGRKTPEPAKDETRAQHSFRAVAELLKGHPLPPSGQARLYRALATIPDLEITQDAHGPQGDQIVIISLKWVNANELSQIILDERDFRYVGVRIAAAKDHVPASPSGTKAARERISAGTVLYGEARTKAVLVDAKGQTG